MNKSLKRALIAAAFVAVAPALAQVTFYEGEGFRGRAFSTDKPVRNFERFGFNDRASSVVVERGSWQVCEDARFMGQCSVLRRGSYDSLAAMGMNNRISSMRPIDDPDRYGRVVAAPLEAPNYAYRRRPEERVFTADVTDVRAVVGPPEQRCWLEREQVDAGRGRGVGGAIAGAVIGGILGHQIGGGRGRDLATAGGAVAGAAVGSNVARGSGGEREVRRCENVADTTPDYWDVTYVFRGAEHRAQMTSPPGRTISVNRNGEPRL